MNTLLAQHRSSALDSDDGRSTGEAINDEPISLAVNDVALAPGGRIPEMHGVVFARRDDVPAIGAKRDGVDAGRVREADAQQRHVPHHVSRLPAEKGICGFFFQRGRGPKQRDGVVGARYCALGGEFESGLGSCADQGTTGHEQQTDSKGAQGPHHRERGRWPRACRA